NNPPETMSFHTQGIWHEGCYQAKQPDLKPEHRRRRINIINQYRNWTFEGLKKIIWIHKTNVNHLGSDSKELVGKITKYANSFDPPYMFWTEIRLFCLVTTFMPDSLSVQFHGLRGVVVLLIFESILAIQTAVLASQIQ